jgi:hypothetical protein
MCKVLCHHLCCLIMSQCALGIEPDFWADEARADEPGAILRFPG